MSFASPPSIPSAPHSDQPENAVPAERSIGQPIRMMLVDDHEIVREGLRHTFEGCPDFEIVAEASHGERALDICANLLPDLVMVDVRMPGMPVVELVRRLRALAAPAEILVFTSYASDVRIVELVEAGARGFVLKDCGRDELLAATRSVSLGRTWLHASAQSALMENAQRLQSPGAQLTPREHSVLLLIAQGLSNKAIASECCLTEGTVKGYISQIFQKLRVGDRTEAALYAVRKGWVELQPVRERAEKRASAWA